MENIELRFGHIVQQRRSCRGKVLTGTGTRLLRMMLARHITGTVVQSVLQSSCSLTRLAMPCHFCVPKDMVVLDVRFPR